MALHRNIAGTFNPENLICEECRELLEQIAGKTVRINARTGKIKALAAEADTAGRLQTIPGVGPLTALAVEVFAAWLGLVPRQLSSGGKERLGRILQGRAC
jgi:transposase